MVHFKDLSCGPGRNGRISGNTGIESPRPVFMRMENIPRGCAYGNPVNERGFCKQLDLVPGPLQMDVLNALELNCV